MNSKSFLSLKTPSFSSIHVLVSLLPADLEYGILDPDSVRKCKFTVKENTSHLVYPTVDNEMDNNETCSVHFWLVYNIFWLYT